MNQKNVQIRTLERVDISDIEVADNHITATASIRGEINDISDEEESELFGKLRGALLKICPGISVGRLGQKLYPAEEKTFTIWPALSQII